jgi:3',5'-cyclic AMP phosphodiesterase CpdA
MFVLAHLSDPHLAPLPTPTLSELAGKRLTGYVNWQRKRRLIHRSDVLARIVANLKTQAVDHIAVTGDLVNLSLPAEYAPAHAWLRSLGPPADVTVVPGNHDAYVRAYALRPQTEWGDYMRGDDAVAVSQPGCAMFPSLRRRGPVALIGLSTAVPTPPFFATGRVGAEQLARLAPLLDRCAQEGLFRIVLIHHPPLSSHPKYLKRLVDAAAVCDVLARHGAELVLHGHDHVHSLAYLDGPRQQVPVVGVPSASEAPPGEHDAAAYNLYRIDEVAGAWRYQMVSRGFARAGGSIVELKRIELKHAMPGA